MVLCAMLQKAMASDPQPGNTFMSYILVPFFQTCLSFQSIITRKRLQQKILYFYTLFLTWCFVYMNFFSKISWKAEELQCFKCLVYIGHECITRNLAPRVLSLPRESRGRTLGTRLSDPEVRSSIDSEHDSEVDESDNLGMGTFIEHFYEVLFVPDAEIDCITVN